MSDDMSEYLPVRVRDYKDDGGPNPIVNEVVLADVVDINESLIEIGFTIGKVRRYVAFRVSDLKVQIAEATASQTEVAP